MSIVPDTELLPGEADLPADQLAADYDARGSVDPAQYEFELERYRTLTDEARAVCPPDATPVYDEASGECLDLYGTGDTPRPLVIFIHGGYWRGLSRLDSAFMAPTLARHGIATASIDYSLVPDVDLREIVRQVRAALAYLWHNADELGLDRSRFVAVGSSAGGHLVGTLLSPGWQSACGLPDMPLIGALPISGLFDLSSITRTKVQDWMNLPQKDVQDLSPLRNMPTTGCRLTLAVAEQDRNGFHRQSRAYATDWAEKQGQVTELTIPNRQHFDVVLDLADDQSRLFAALLDLLRA